ncbi:hypothetical protein [Kitasatospora phosalacinea]|uniref:Uncharacterized protein n=1 Tax=Kitasatospora phosalacinea TaxID=2065 RepID=A0A9W6PC50_9ACTN|nr:hypothetical protein [Kitasatospora phosalacinea]GLW52267.1 hypothetical protein Kpho01_02780 [Kitasatospora phosalacinea]
MHLRPLVAVGLLALAAGAAALTAPAPAPADEPSPAPAPGTASSPAPGTAPSPSPEASPSSEASSAPEAPPTAVTITGAAVDPKVPSRVRVTLAYTCAPTGQPRSLNTSVEQPDPEDPATTAFGATRTSPTLVLCDGTPQAQTVTVQSKTSTWLTGTDSVVVTTLTDLGATPPAVADARRIRLDLPPVP